MNNFSNTFLIMQSEIAKNIGRKLNTSTNGLVMWKNPEIKLLR